MEIRVLGPLQVSGADGALYLRGPRQRVVLSILALNANRVTTLEQLIDAVWGGDPPGTPRTQVQATISGLRRLFTSVDVSARIVTRDPGYVLQINGELLDSHVFGALVGAAKAHELDGDYESAVGALRSALSLWRGPALADVPDDAVRLAAGGLDERRVAAEVERIRLELLLGRHVEVVPDLRALLEAHPLREDLYEYLMLALYRCARQFDALETFRRARRILIDEVGVEPSKDLRELERAILRRDKTLDLPTTASSRSANVVPRQVAPPLNGSLPPGAADFTGRKDELRAIVEMLSNAEDTAGFLPTVAISGRGGIGKTCLAVQAAHVLGHRFPGGHLYADLRLAGGPEGVLTSFLRSLGVSPARLPEEPQEKVELYRSLLTSRRVLVVLDGVCSEEQVLSLLPGLPGCAAVVTSRRRLVTLPGARLVHLSELGTQDSLEFLVRQLGRRRVYDEYAAAVSLIELCAGLPLALRIAAARLAARPYLRIVELSAQLADPKRRLDELSYRGLDLRSTIASTYAAMPGAARRTFRRLGMLCQAVFSPEAAAPLLETDVNSARQSLDVLVDEGILDVSESAGLVSYRCDALIGAYAQEVFVCESAGCS